MFKSQVLLTQYILSTAVSNYFDFRQEIPGRATVITVAYAVILSRPSDIRQFSTIFEVILILDRSSFAVKPYELFSSIKATVDEGFIDKRSSYKLSTTPWLVGFYHQSLNYISV